MKNPSARASLLPLVLVLAVLGLASSCRGIQIRQLEHRIDQLESRMSNLEGRLAANPGK
jgi:hypothetical protein